MLKVGFGVDALTSVLTGSQPDGIAVYVRELRAALRMIDRVDLIPVIYRGRHAKAALTESEKYTSFTLPYAPAALWSSLTGAAFLGGTRIGREIDVYHAPDTRVPRLRKTPVIATLFDVIPLRHPEWASPGGRALKNHVIRRAAQWADMIIAISNSAAQDIAEEHGIQASRIATIPLGIGSDWFAMANEKRRAVVLERYNLQPGYFLAVGTLQPRKNIDRILDAHHLLPIAMQKDRPLVVVGRQGWRAVELSARLRHLEARGRVRWLQYVSRIDLQALYQSARCFVFPSLYEGFGLPILEAFASGTPVISACTSSIPEVAGDAAVLVDPTDSAAIAAAMENVSNDDNFADELIERGRKRVRNYSWSKCAEQTCDVYHSLG